MIPLLVLSLFRGSDVLVHGHQGESAHLHMAPLSIAGGAAAAAARHDEAHGHSHAHDHGAPASDSDDSPLGLQVTIHDHEQLPSRRVQVASDAEVLAEVLINPVVIDAWASLLLALADDIAGPERPPTRLSSVERTSGRFSDRRARTSNAFLI
ncbi:MAG: hypothetical protein KF684_08465 [Phycisphaeraceae bacterium]|nr:hypothetical protein [Phycisphaeraceae bacterium]